MSQPRRVRAACAALLAVSLAGCSGAGTGPVEPPTTPTTHSTTSTTRAETSQGDPTTPSPTLSTTSPSPKTTVEEVAYIPWGPADPVIPEHYGQLARRDCDAAEAASPDGDFWTVVYGVCRALNQGAAWPEASSAPAQPETDNPHERCLNAELGTMVEAALEWHATNPGATAHVDYPETGSPCFTSVYSSAQLTPEEDGTDPGAGQVTVAVVIDSTYDLASVSVDGSAVDQDAYTDAGNDPQIGTRTISVHVPAPEQVSQIAVDLGLSQGGDDRGTATATVDLSLTSSVTTDGSGSSDGSDNSDGSDGADSSDGSGSAGADGS